MFLDALLTLYRQLYFLLAWIGFFKSVYHRLVCRLAQKRWVLVQIIENNLRHLLDRHASCRCQEFFTQLCKLLGCIGFSIEWAKQYAIIGVEHAHNVSNADVGVVSINSEIVPFNMIKQFGSVPKSCLHMSCIYSAKQNKD